MTVVEAKGFFNLVSAPAVTLNYPFSLLFSAWRVLEPFRLECVRIPLVRADKNGRIIRIVIFYVACHRFSPVARCYSAGVQPPRKIVDEFILLQKLKSLLLFRSLSVPVMK